MKIPFNVSDVLYAIKSPLFISLVIAAIALWYIFFVIFKKKGYDYAGKRLGTIGFLFWIVIFACVFFGLFAQGYNRRVYSVGLTYIQLGDYKMAWNTLDSIQSGYSKATRLMEDIKEPYLYQMASEYRESGDLLKAASLYAEIMDYKDSKDELVDVMVEYNLMERRKNSDNDKTEEITQQVNK